MSFDYFSKDRVEYILSKLKTLFDKKQDLEWVGTKAQYETQRTSISPGTIVNITDDYSGGGGSGGSHHVYSTEEQVVGTWLNGKPIYELSVTGLNITYSQSSEKSISVGFKSEHNAEEIIEGTWRGLSSVSTGQLRIGIMFLRTNGDLGIYAPSSGTITGFTIQYTKTTD